MAPKKNWVLSHPRQRQFECRDDMRREFLGITREQMQVAYPAHRLDQWMTWPSNRTRIGSTPRCSGLRACMASLRTWAGGCGRTASPSPSPAYWPIGRRPSRGRWRRGRGGNRRSRSETRPTRWRAGRKWPRCWGRGLPRTTGSSARGWSRLPESRSSHCPCRPRTILCRDFSRDPPCATLRRLASGLRLALSDFRFRGPYACKGSRPVIPKRKSLPVWIQKKLAGKVHLWRNSCENEFTCPGEGPRLNINRPVGSLVRNLKDIEPPRLLFQAGKT